MCGIVLPPYKRSRDSVAQLAPFSVFIRLVVVVTWYFLFWKVEPGSNHLQLATCAAAASESYSSQFK